MSQSEYDVAIAAFIRSKGITRCPTACVVRTQGTVSKSDREALQNAPPKSKFSASAGAAAIHWRHSTGLSSATNALTPGESACRGR